MKNIIIILYILMPLLMNAQSNDSEEVFNFKVDTFYFSQNFKIKESNVLSIVQMLNDSVPLKPFSKYSDNTEGLEVLRYQLSNCFGIKNKYIEILNAIVFCRYEYVVSTEENARVDVFELHFANKEDAKLFFDKFRRCKKNHDCNYPWHTIYYVVLVDSRILYFRDAFDSEDDQLRDIVNFMLKQIKPIDFFVKI